MFVGPNASGKSAIADALTITKPEKTDHWKLGDKLPVWTVPASNVKNNSHSPMVLGNSRQKIALALPALREDIEANETWTLDSTGRNLANLFDTLSRDEQSSFVSVFTNLVPVYSDIKARAKKGRKRLQFQDRWQADLWYESLQVSDGTILTAALVALGFQRYAPDLVVIEDPDSALHPYLQRHVVEMLRKLSKGEVGDGPMQIVCTTHSQSFLNCLEPQEVCFIRRSRETGETEVHKAPVDNPNWHKVYDQFQDSLGNMWLTGALGGVPGI